MNDANFSRKELIQFAAASAVAGTPANLLPTSMSKPSSFLSLLRHPDLVRAFGPENEEIALIPSGSKWTSQKVEIETTVFADRLAVSMEGGGVARIQLRWRGDLSRIRLYLGDHWERSYADLEWRGEAPNRVLPWYFLARDEVATHGYGVKTGAGAMCFWTADSEGISLWADVRSGGVPVELLNRRLPVAEVVCREGKGESAFAATQAFCRQMSPHPRLPVQPVYGTNDWNYAYGNNSAELIAGVSGLVSELADDHNNRPYSVIDEGWAIGPFKGQFGHGPWEGNPRFGDMAAFANRLKSLGVRPGIWFRPLTPLPDSPESWRLSRDKNFLDPTVPEVHAYVSQEIRKLVGWGYELVKHDFTTWDFLGLWGFEMGPSPTPDGWRPHDASQTNAEILTGLYGAIRAAAGDATLIGCNTVGHLTAGTHELQRIGDDTSGRSWNRNRRMGVNTLAFRAPQHGAFFDVDPDIVAITKAVPWFLVDEWLRLVSESGAALFVAVEPSIVEPKHRQALKTAFDLASKPQPIGQPLDWLESVCPRHWKLGSKSVEFAWMGDSGAWPFSDKQ
jgi:alpha-galactosidase